MQGFKYHYLRKAIIPKLEHKIKIEDPGEEKYRQG